MNCVIIAHILAYLYGEAFLNTIFEIIICITYGILRLVINQFIPKKSILEKLVNDLGRNGTRERMIIYDDIVIIESMSSFEVKSILSTKKYSKNFNSKFFNKELTAVIERIPSEYLSSVSHNITKNLGNPNVVLNNDKPKSDIKSESFKKFNSLVNHFNDILQINQKINKRQKAIDQIITHNALKNKKIVENNQKCY
ncbi:hypothetical protein HERIO_2030 [Hepatospora eriocheir]|uniref:Uncharacterized protein n=1 Tax=Hepatospora eriocheir TaxID=1081669 RepID=A0A1X0Q8B2_9MICR|nr:hypothetical protein HERIO_2030 [Hepatospora eriocheir]